MADPRDDDFNKRFSDLTNALAAAAPLATRLRRDLSEHVEDALALEAAIDRAVRAVRDLRPTKGGGR
jgi:hypothetical protein